MHKFWGVFNPLIHPFWGGIFTTFKVCFSMKTRWFLFFFNGHRGWKSYSKQITLLDSFTLLAEISDDFPHPWMSQCIGVSSFPLEGQKCDTMPPQNVYVSWTKAHVSSTTYVQIRGVCRVWLVPGKVCLSKKRAVMGCSCLCRSLTPTLAPTPVTFHEVAVVVGLSWQVGWGRVGAPWNPLLN